MAGKIQVGISHNISTVIADIDDVKNDLRNEMRKRVGSAMAVLQADVSTYIINDPHTTGQLLRSIGRESDTAGDTLEFMVYTDPKIAPYAAIVEFGSGTNTNVSWRGSAKAEPPDQYPPDYPFSSPDIQNYSGFAYYIEEWMREKGVTPKYDSYRASALAITKAIDQRGNYAHPYMRPAWFDNELLIKRAARNALRNAVR